MISKAEIEKNLIFLESKYDVSSDAIETLMYSKLAMLELCGWIELSIDELIRCCASHNLLDNRSIKIIEDDIKHNYGFEYKRHFRKMFCGLIGLIAFEKIESAANPQTLQNFKSALGNLKVTRDKEVHTFIVATRVIDAPSKAKLYMNQVYDGLTEFENLLKSESLLP